MSKLDDVQSEKQHLFIEFLWNFSLILGLCSIQWVGTAFAPLDITAPDLIPLESAQLVDTTLTMEVAPCQIASPAHQADTATSQHWLKQWLLQSAMQGEFDFLLVSNLKLNFWKICFSANIALFSLMQNSLIPWNQEMLQTLFSWQQLLRQAVN